MPPPPGEEFVHGGRTYQRRRYPAVRDHDPAGLRRLHATHLDTGTHVDLLRAEERALWTWAVVDTFFYTGVRVEELLEITQTALTTLRLPDTGETVPLLQIVPSKTDAERTQPRSAAGPAVTAMKSPGGQTHKTTEGHGNLSLQSTEERLRAVSRDRSRGHPPDKFADHGRPRQHPGLAGRFRSQQRLPREPAGTQRTRSRVVAGRPGQSIRRHRTHRDKPLPCRLWSGIERGSNLVGAFAVQRT